MARKRGGLAGLYDRNKGLFRTAAILGGTALGGPAGGAAAGAAMRGLDREGKSGIGFDVGQGLRGAAEGYAMGKTAVGAKNAISGMLAPKAVAGAAYDVTNVPGIGMGLGGDPATAGNFWYGGQSPLNMDPFGLAQQGGQQAAQSGVMGKIGRGVNRAMDFANKYEKPLGAMIRGTGMVPNPEAEALAAKNEIEQSKLEFERQQYADEQERRRRIAELLMPMYRQMSVSR